MPKDKKGGKKPKKEKEEKKEGEEPRPPTPEHLKPLPKHGWMMLKVSHLTLNYLKTVATLLPVSP